MPAVASAVAGTSLALQPERWHRLEGEDCYNALITACNDAIEYNRTRRSVALEFAALFEGMSLTSFGARGYQTELRVASARCSRAYPQQEPRTAEARAPGLQALLRPAPRAAAEGL